MRIVYDREHIRDIKSRYIQRLKINEGINEAWIELYQVESKFFIRKIQVNKLEEWVEVSNKVVNELMVFDDEKYYTEALKFFKE